MGEEEVAAGGDAAPSFVDGAAAEERLRLQAEDDLRDHLLG